MPLSRALCDVCSSQIKAESFVEDINNLLNSGEVPNMFPYDERAGICEAVRHSLVGAHDGQLARTSWAQASTG